MTQETLSNEKSSLNPEGRTIHATLLLGIGARVPAERLAKVHDALDLALTVHADQKPRPDGPYVNHVLRVTSRGVTEFGVSDPELIQAFALHDTIEDQAEKLAARLPAGAKEGTPRERALEYIKREYGDETARIVLAATNPEKEPGAKLDDDQEVQMYSEHVRNAIEDVKVLYLKLSDFMDNGLKVKNISELKSRHWLAKKYLPVYRHFIERLQKDDVVLPEGKKEEIIQKLKEAEQFAKDTDAQASTPDWVGF